MNATETSALELLLRDNRRRFRRKQGKGFVVADAMHAHPLIAETTMRIAEAVCAALDAELAALHLGHRAKDETRLILSHRPRRHTSFTRRAIAGAITHPFAVLGVLARISDGAALLAWMPGGIPAGKHLYDALLIGTGRPHLRRLTARERVRIGAEACFLFGVKDWLESVRPLFAILPDNTYRSGMLFELFRANSVPSIAGIDASGVAMHFYRDRDDYQDHCRTPDPEVVAEVMASPEALASATEYLDNRTAGAEDQHDVVRAYAPSKRMVTRQHLNAEYGLKPKLPIVLVMAHVFSDAPHAYPDTLFGDYDEWLRWTVQRLRSAGRVNVLVKRHPSSLLYGEETLLERVLSDIGAREALLADDINTRALFDAVDVVLTCGGTPGMEFPCHGVPVVVAARPPYAAFGYTHRAADIEGYGEMLDAIHALPRLTPDQVRTARAVMYAIQERMKIPPSILGFGSQRLRPDALFDRERFYREILGDEEGRAQLETAIARLLTDGRHNLDLLEVRHLTSKVFEREPREI